MRQKAAFMAEGRLKLQKKESSRSLFRQGNPFPLISFEALASRYFSLYFSVFYSMLYGLIKAIGRSLSIKDIMIDRHASWEFAVNNGKKLKPEPTVLLNI